MMIMIMKINRCNPLCELQRKIRRYIYPHSDSEIGKDDNIDQRKSHHHHHHGAAGWPSLASHIGSGYLAERVYSGNLPLTTIMMSTMGLKKVKVAMTMAMTITMAMAMAKYRWLPWSVIRLSHENTDHCQQSELMLWLHTPILWWRWWWWHWWSDVFDSLGDKTRHYCP